MVTGGDIAANLTTLGLTKWETKAYLSLVGEHPVNGSQLSRHSGIPRARIYDVLRSLRDKGVAIELGDGQYAPLPPEELYKRLRRRFETDLGSLEKRIEATSVRTDYDYVWTIQGYDEVMAKAKEMISSAQREIYIRPCPQEGEVLDDDLHRAAGRGVEVKYISLGYPPSLFDLQVVHPETKRVEEVWGGRLIDLVKDREEILVGVFLTGQEDHSPINWTKNQWFVNSSRDSLRHDFFHYFLHKIYDLKQPLSEKEKRLYELIRNDL